MRKEGKSDRVLIVLNNLLLNHFVGSPFEWKKKNEKRKRKKKRR